MIGDGRERRQGEQPEEAESIRLVLHALDRGLRRTADQRTKGALQIQVLRVAGYTDEEARVRLVLSVEDYQEAKAALEVELRILRAAPTP